MRPGRKAESTPAAQPGFQVGPIANNRQILPN
jgi:hypothetical protein